MKLTNYTLGLAAIFTALTLAGCDPEIDAPKASSGEADFSRYVSLGNSLTSGFADGALYRAGQQVSYPSIMAEQFKLAGGGEFKQPLITVGADGDIGVGVPVINSPTNILIPAKLVLGTSTDCRGTASLGPVRASASGDASILLVNRIGAQGPYNNLGVVGALSYHLLAPGYGSDDLQKILTGQANPFFSRFASSGNTSIVQEAMAQNPTFFTLWIGSNDVLGYALNGGTGSDPTPLNGPAGVGFRETMTALVNMLTAGGAKGALGNIPDVSKIPFFTTVPANGLVLDAASATGLNQAYAQLGLTFQAGNNPFVIADNTAPGGRRKIAAGELILLSIPQDSIKCAGWGSLKPIPDRYVLTQPEITRIANTIRDYNTEIKKLADAKGLAYADANAYLSDLQQGKTINQVNYSAALVTGNVFSLDGIHFSPRGNAIAANLFIEAINKQYNATIPTVDITRYPAVKFP